VTGSIKRDFAFALMSQTIHPYERVRVADAPPRSINELFFSPPASDVGNVGTRMFKVANVDGGEGTFSNLKMAWGRLWLPRKPAP
jgi:hypothetical protein